MLSGRSPGKLRWRDQQVSPLRLLRCAPVEMTILFKFFLTLAGEFTQEFAFVHVVLEGFVAVDEDDRHFVGELAA